MQTAIVLAGKGTLFFPSSYTEVHKYWSHWYDFSEFWWLIYDKFCDQERFSLGSEKTYVGKNWNTEGFIWASGNPFPLGGWMSTGTDYPRKWWIPHPWDLQKPCEHGSGQLPLGGPAWGVGVAPGGLQRLLPALWLCDSDTTYRSWDNRIWPSVAFLWRRINPSLKMSC